MCTRWRNRGGHLPARIGEYDADDGGAMGVMIGNEETRCTPQTPGCHNITAATVTRHTKSHASGTCESDNSFRTFQAVYLFEYQSTYNFSSAQNFVLIIQTVHIWFAFERVQQFQDFSEP